jgi:hypothetical protein
MRGKNGKQQNTTILLPKPSNNLLMKCFAAGTKHSRLGVFQTYTLPDVGNSTMDEFSDHIKHL